VPESGSEPALEAASAVRDGLARERTHLANERTLLAYVRTGLALGLSGASALHFLTGPLSDGLGLMLILSGAACLAWGCMRFLATRRKLQS
jgi:putative membrane protein